MATSPISTRPPGISESPTADQPLSSSGVDVTLSGGATPSLPGPLVDWFKECGLPPCTAVQLSQPHFFQVHILRLCHSLSAGQRPVPPLSKLLPGPEKVAFNWDVVLRGIGAIGFVVIRERQDRLRDSGSMPPSGLFEDFAVEMHKWWSNRAGQLINLTPHQTAMQAALSHKITTAICGSILRDIVNAACDKGAIAPTRVGAAGPGGKRLTGQPSAPRSMIMLQRYQANLAATEILQGIVECVVSGLTAPGDLERVVKANPAVGAIDAHHRRTNLEKGHLYKMRQRELEVKNKAFKSSKEEVREMLVQLRAEKESKDRAMLEDLRQQEARLREIMERQRKQQTGIKLQQKATVGEYRQKQSEEAAAERARELELAEKQKAQNEERVRLFQMKKQQEREHREEINRRSASITPSEAAVSLFGKTPCPGGRSQGWLSSVEEEVLTTMYEVLRNGKPFAPFCAQEDTRAYLMSSHLQRLDALEVPEISAGLTFSATHMLWSLMRSPHGRLSSGESTAIWKHYGKSDKMMTRTEVVCILPPSPPSCRHVVAAILNDPESRRMLHEHSPSHSHISICVECTPSMTAVVMLSCARYLPRLVPEMMDTFKKAMPLGSQGVADAVIDASRFNTASWKDAARDGVLKMKKVPRVCMRGMRQAEGPRGGYHADPSEPKTTTVTPAPPDEDPHTLIYKKSDIKARSEPPAASENNIAADASPSPRANASPGAFKS